MRFCDVYNREHQGAKIILIRRPLAHNSRRFHDSIRRRLREQNSHTRKIRARFKLR